MRAPSTCSLLLSFRFPTRARRPDHLAHNVQQDDTRDRNLLESRQVSAGRHDSFVHERTHGRPQANLYPAAKRAERHQEDRAAGHVRAHLEPHVCTTMPEYVSDISRPPPRSFSPAFSYQGRVARVDKNKAARRSRNIRFFSAYLFFPSLFLPVFLFTVSSVSTESFQALGFN